MAFHINKLLKMQFFFPIKTKLLGFLFSTIVPIPPCNSQKGLKKFHNYRYTLLSELGKVEPTLAYLFIEISAPKKVC